MELFDNPALLLAAFAAVLIAGVSKGGFGGGLGVLAVPLLALAVSPTRAAAIMLPVLCLMDIMSIWAWRGKWDLRALMFLVPAAVVGIVIGSFSFKYLNGPLVGLLIGMIAVLFTLDWLYKQFRNRKSQTEIPPRPLTPGRTGFWGSIAGFTSFVAHAGGPPLNMVLLPVKMEKARYQATTTLFFFSVNAVKLLPYALLGQFPVNNLEISAILAPFALAAVWLGVWLHKRIPTRWFYFLCYSLLLVTGIKLVVEGGLWLLAPV